MTNYGKKHTEAHWNRVWAQLKARGVVEVDLHRIVPFTSSCKALADLIENPGATRNVRVRLQSQSGDSSFPKGDCR